MDKPILPNQQTQQVNIQGAQAIAKMIPDIDMRAAFKELNRVGSQYLEANDGMQGKHYRAEKNNRLQAIVAQLQSNPETMNNPAAWTRELERVVPDIDAELDEKYGNRFLDANNFRLTKEQSQLDVHDMYTNVFAQSVQRVGALNRDLVAQEFQNALYNRDYAQAASLAQSEYFTPADKLKSIEAIRQESFFDQRTMAYAKDHRQFFSDKDTEGFKALPFEMQQRLTAAGDRARGEQHQRVYDARFYAIENREVGKDGNPLVTPGGLLKDLNNDDLSPAMYSALMGKFANTQKATGGNVQALLNDPGFAKLREDWLNAGGDEVQQLKVEEQIRNLATQRYALDNAQLTRVTGSLSRTTPVDKLLANGETQRLVGAVVTAEGGVEYQARKDELAAHLKQQGATVEASELIDQQTARANASQMADVANIADNLEKRFPRGYVSRQKFTEEYPGTPRWKLDMAHNILTAKRGADESAKAVILSQPLTLMAADISNKASKEVRDRGLENMQAAFGLSPSQAQAYYDKLAALRERDAFAYSQVMQRLDEGTKHIKPAMIEKHVADIPVSSVIRGNNGELMTQDGTLLKTKGVVVPYLTGVAITQDEASKLYKNEKNMTIERFRELTGVKINQWGDVVNVPLNRETMVPGTIKRHADRGRVTDHYRILASEVSNAKEIVAGRQQALQREMLYLDASRKK